MNCSDIHAYIFDTVTDPEVYRCPKCGVNIADTRQIGGKQHGLSGS